jgi:glycosyltransferase involved in cell wall biosynthesis
MKVWYVNHYAPGPKTPKEGRAYFLAKGIVLNGGYCAVICAGFHHLNREKVAQKETCISKVVDGVPFVWVKTPSYVGNGLSRLINMFSFAFNCLKINFIKECNLQKPDVIIISSAHPFHYLAGLRWARKYNAKLVFEVRDLWPLSLNLLLGLSKYHPLSILISIFERLAYKKSDLIVSLLPNALEYMSAYGVDSSRFISIPNGYSYSVLPSLTCDLDSQLAKIRGSYKLVIMHTGSMGVPNGLEMLISIANSFMDIPDVSFVFIGDGNCKSKLQSMNLSKHVFFFEPVPKNQVNQALSYADIGYCGSQEGLCELYKYGVSPNKIFDYMAAQKFILFVVDSINTPVEIAKCGVRYSPSDINGIKEFINKAILDDKVNFDEAGLVGKAYLDANHDFLFLSKCLLEKLKKL